MTEKAQGLTVAVTGAAGYLAGRVVSGLCDDPRVARVVGLDVREPAFRHERFVFDHLDVRNPALESRLSGADVVVHLAFIMDPIKDTALMRDVNVNGSANVFSCAGAAGVQHVVYASSATVYGAHRDNDVPLTESSPLRANLDFPYAAHKLEVEYVVREFRAEHPEAKVAVLRPAIVMGPHVDNAWSHVLEWPVLFGVEGFSPPLQFLHEDDFASAVLFAVGERLDGVYNVAADGWLAMEQVLEVLGRRRFDLDEERVFKLMDSLWVMGVGEAPSAILHYAMHPWVMATDALAAAGWRPQRTNEEALSAAAERGRPYVRFGRARVRRVALAAGAGGAAALAAAGFGRRAVLSR